MTPYMCHKLALSSTYACLGLREKKKSQGAEVMLKNSLTFQSKNNNLQPSQIHLREVQGERRERWHADRAIAIELQTSSADWTGLVSRQFRNEYP